MTIQNIMNSKGFLRAERFKLFIVAIGMLFSIGWASAQSRYSINVVLYVDASFAAGSNFVTNPVNAENNTVARLFTDMPNGSLLTSWDPSIQSYGPTNVFNQPTGWSNPTATFNFPSGALLLLPSPKQITFVGELPGIVGILPCVNFGPYFSLVGFLPRGPCGFCADFNTCSSSLPDDTALIKWVRQGQYPLYYYYYLGGWVDANYNPADPHLDPDEAGFFFFPQSFQAVAPAGSGIVRSNVPLGRTRSTGSSLDFGFATSNTTAYALLCRTNFTSSSWQVVQRGTAYSTGGVASINIPGATNKMAFYKMVGSLPSSNAVFLNETRKGSSFQCEFYAPITANYELQRVLVLTNPSAQTWQTVATISATASNVVTVTDTTATSTRGYYRLRY